MAVSSAASSRVLLGEMLDERENAHSETSKSQTEPSRQKSKAQQYKQLNTMLFHHSCVSTTEKTTDVMGQDINNISSIVGKNIMSRSVEWLFPCFTMICLTNNKVNPKGEKFYRYL